MNTDVVDIYPMKFTKQFVNTLEDNVRFRGVPTKLVSDRAQVEIRPLQYAPTSNPKLLIPIRTIIWL